MKLGIPWRSVADPHYFDADPDPAWHFDPDPKFTFHFDADPEPDPSFQIMAQKLWTLSMNMDRNTGLGFRTYSFTFSIVIPVQGKTCCLEQGPVE